MLNKLKKKKKNIEFAFILLDHILIVVLPDIVFFGESLPERFFPLVMEVRSIEMILIHFSIYFFVD